MTGKLTPKQAIFIAEFLVDGNATRAAIAAGYAQASADVTGSKLLKRKHVSAAIAERRARRVMKLEEHAELIDQELRNAVTLDVGRFYDEAGARIPIHRLPEDVRKAISVFEDETRGTTHIQRVKLLDKLRAIELLGKRSGLFIDHLQHDGKVTLEQLVCGHGGSEDSTGEQAD